MIVIFFYGNDITIVNPFSSTMIVANEIILNCTLLKSKKMLFTFITRLDFKNSI